MGGDFSGGNKKERVNAKGQFQNMSGPLFLFGRPVVDYHGCAHGRHSFTKTGHDRLTVADHARLPACFGALFVQHRQTSPASAAFRRNFFGAIVGSGPLVGPAGSAPVLLFFPSLPAWKKPWRHPLFPCCLVFQLNMHLSPRTISTTVGRNHCWRDLLSGPRRPNVFPHWSTDQTFLGQKRWWPCWSLGANPLVPQSSPQNPSGVVDSGYLWGQRLLLELLRKKSTDSCETTRAPPPRSHESMIPYQPRLDKR